MFNEPIKEKYEKVFYSPDKVSRLIVSKNTSKYCFYKGKMLKTASS